MGSYIGVRGSPNGPWVDSHASGQPQRTRLSFAWNLISLRRRESTRPGSVAIMKDHKPVQDKKNHLFAGVVEFTTSPLVQNGCERLASARLSSD